MQEFAIILSSLAGVATAAAVRKMPRNKTKLLSLGASSHIRSQISSLKIEKDILTKTISRLYQADSEYSKIQRDKLLLKYQHQLGIVLAKLEKLEQASHHPDLGPVGDGLITLMDQKLSKLDDRLYELSSKIQTSEIKPKTQQKVETEESKEQEVKKQEKQKAEPFKFDQNTKPFTFPSNTKGTSFELATLTRFSKKEPKFFTQQKQYVKPKEDIVDEVIQPKPKVEDKVEIVNTSQTTQPKVETTKPEPPKEPKPQAPLGPKPDLTNEVSKISQYKALPSPQEKPKKIDDDFEEDDSDDDIDKIKGDIMRVLAKLDQAEVE